MSKRSAQVSSELQQQLSKIISKEIEIPLGSLVTLTRVSLSPDLKIAKVFISVFPESKRGTILNFLLKSTNLIRKQLKSQIRFYTLPQIHFFIDEDEIKRKRVIDALDKIEKED